MGGEELSAGLGRVEGPGGPDMPTTVDPDEDDFGAVSTTGGGEAVHGAPGTSSTGAFGHPSTLRQPSAIASAGSISLGPPRPTIPPPV